MALDCTTCGACCMNGAGIPYEEAERAGVPLSAERLAEFIHKDETRPMAENAWCEWLTNPEPGRWGCLYYDERPDACRGYDVGCKACLKAREHMGVDAP